MCRNILIDSHLATPFGVCGCLEIDGFFGFMLCGTFWKSTWGCVGVVMSHCSGWVSI